MSFDPTPKSIFYMKVLRRKRQNNFQLYLKVLRRKRCISIQLYRIYRNLYI